MKNNKIHWIELLYGEEKYKKYIKAKWFFFVMLLALL